MDYGNNILREYAPEMDQISKDCLVNVSLRGYMLPVIWMLVVSEQRTAGTHLRHIDQLYAYKTRKYDPSFTAGRIC